MNFNVSSIKLTGNPQKLGWTQAHDFEPKEDEKLKSRGRLIAVVSLYASDNEESKSTLEIQNVETGREILARLHEEYFGSNADSPYNALQKAVEKVSSEFLKDDLAIEIVAVSLVGGAVFSAACGGAKLYLYRDLGISTLLNSEDECIAVSGHPKKADVLVLGTARMFDLVPSGRLKAILSKGEKGAIDEQLGPLIHSSSDQEKLGLVIIKFDEKGQLSSKLTPLKKVKEEKRTSIKVNIPAGGFRKRLTSFRKRIPEKRLYIKREEQDLDTVKRRRVSFSVGAILLLLLAVSIVFGLRQKRLNERSQQFEDLYRSAEHEINEAKEIYSLNPQRARELINLSRTKMEELEQLDYEDEKLADLRKKIDDSSSSILGEYDVQVSSFFDLSLITDEFSGDELSESDGTIYIVDYESKKIVSIAIDTKRSEVVAGPGQLSGLDKFSSYVGKVYALLADGIYRVGEDKEKLIDKDWDGGVEMNAYTGNLYVLNKSDSKIYRYAGVGGSYSSKKNWLLEDINVDLSDAVSMEIDGSIWVLDESGGIKRFSLGNLVSYKTGEIFPGLSSPKAVYVDEEIESVYILEPSQKRVVVTDKEGSYVAQYLSDEIEGSKDLVVSESEKKIVFLKNGKLYSIELKHLR